MIRAARGDSRKEASEDCRHMRKTADRLEFKGEKGEKMGTPIKVESYSGYKADERPATFTVAEQTLQVMDLVDRWYDIDHNYFKVLADDNRFYLLRHDMNSDQWELVESEAASSGVP